MPDNLNQTVSSEVMPPVIPKKAYTIQEAAVLLRRCDKSVRRLIDRGVLRRDKKFWRVMIPCKDVDNYFENHSE